jgi:hypothetical protein
MRNMSVAEKKYQAILAVIAQGRTIGEVATQWRVSHGPCTAGWRGMSWREWKVSPSAPTGPGAAPTR